MGDSCDNILRKALNVSEIPQNFDPKKTPQTGEEYLHHVMYEAMQCDEWVRADIDTSKIKNQVCIVQELIGCTAAPQKLRPTQTWQREQVSDFAEFRFHLNRIKNHNNKPKCIQFSGQEEHWKQTCSKGPPQLSDVAYMNQHCVVRLLELHTGWLEEVPEGQSLTHSAGVWLYALLACLETPLWPEACATLRDLARHCSQVRSRLNEDTPLDMYVSLNLLICLIARYFDQADLADEIE